MADRRYAAAGGLVFVACGVISGAVLPKQPPAPNADGAKVRTYFVAHHDAILVGSVLAAVAAVALLPFFAALRELMRGPSAERAPATSPTRVAADTAYLAGAGVVAVGLLGAVLQAGLAHTASRMDPSSAVAAFALERAVFYVAPAFVVAVLGGAAALGGSALPQWLRGLSGLLAVVGAVAAVVGVLATSTAGSALGFAGFALTVLWTACSSVVLLRLSESAPLRRPAPVAAQA